MLDLKTDMYLDPQFQFGTYSFDLLTTEREVVYVITVQTNLNSQTDLKLEDLISSVVLAPGTHLNRFIILLYI